MKQLLVAFTNGRLSLITQDEIHRCQAFANAVSGQQDALTLVNKDVVITGHTDGQLKSWNSGTGELLRQSRLLNAEIYELDVDESSGPPQEFEKGQQKVIPKNLSTESRHWRCWTKAKLTGLLVPFATAKLIVPS